MSFKVYSEPCKNCLLSKDRIVPAKRAKQIINDCKMNQSYFICHKSDDTCCSRFYKEIGHHSQMIRIAERLGAIEYIEQKDTEKLTPYLSRQKIK